MIRFAILAAAALALLPAGHASAQTYKYSRILYPKNQVSTHDINKSGIVVGGYFPSIGGLRPCFTYDMKSKNRTDLNDPDGANGTECWGINDAGTIVGDYYDANSNQNGYIYDGKNWTTINPPNSVATTAEGISNTGLVSGKYLDSSGNQHGFIYDGKTYTTVDVKGDTTVDVFGINSAGDYVLSAVDNSGATVSWLVSGKKKTPMNFPGSSLNAGHHINDAGLVSATWGDANGVYHGGVWDTTANTYSDVFVPNSSATIGDGVNVKGVVAGRYQGVNGKSIGYAATPAKTASFHAPARNVHTPKAQGKQVLY